MRKLLVYIVIVFMCYAQSDAKSVSVFPRFGIGPSWHHFFSYQVFDLTPLGITTYYPNQERIESAWDLMPYFEGRVAIESCSGITACITAGGGSVHKGLIGFDNPIQLYPIANYSLSFFNDAYYKATIQRVDANLGYIFAKKIAHTALQPLLGYNFNNEFFFSHHYGLPNTYCMRNCWQGPYIGIKLCNSHTKYTLTASYKCVIGSVHSALYTQTRPTVTLPPPDTPCSRRKAHMLGTLLEFEGMYHHRSHAVGVQFSFNNYHNYSTGTVCFCAPTNNKIIRSQLRKIQWDQIITTVFFEYQF